jgi:catechol 2,3-dioxygenase-like lactoylglutathione lyase family enzyme
MTLNRLGILATLGAVLAASAPIADAQAQTPAADRPRIYGIAHVTVRTSQPAAADTFYASTLGLPRGAGAGCQVYRVGPRQRVHVEPGLPAGEDERLVSVGFITESTERLRTWLRARNVTVDDATRCGQRVLRVVDPEGHVIEFVDPSSTSASASTPGSGGSAGLRILHAGLTVKDAAVMDRFYAETLGFSEIWRGGSTDTVVNWINMKTPDGTEYIEYMLLGSEPLTRARLGSMHHIAIVVDDMQEAYEAVLARVPRERWKELGSPRVGRNRRWQLNLFDPDGTRTELMERHTMR